MNLAIIDPEGKVTVAASEGRAALDRGDTDLARRKHAEAAKIVEDNLPSAKSEGDRNLNLFLAATQRYEGGDYAGAIALAQLVRKQDLPDRVGKLLPDFLEKARNRAVDDYADQVEERLKGLWYAKQYQAVIELLQEHPYAFAPKRLAMIRGMCCKGLGVKQVAETFFRDAREFDSIYPCQTEKTAGSM